MDIKTFLDQNKITRKEFAEMVQIKPGYLNHLVSGERKPSVKLIARIKKATDGLITEHDLRPELNGDLAQNA